MSRSKARRVLAGEASSPGTPYLMTRPGRGLTRLGDGPGKVQMLDAGQARAVEVGMPSGVLRGGDVFHSLR